MKKLLTLLVRRGPPIGPRREYSWWHMQETSGDDPPTERASMFTYPQIVEMIRHKIERVIRSHNEIDP